MVRSFAAAAVFFAFLPHARAEQTSFVWSVPKGWRTETIPFPLPFAPELPHKGLVELRFSPGMFKADSEELWTYSFVWWLEGEAKLNAAALSKQLEQYFGGLTKAVEADKERHPTPVTAVMKETAKSGDRFEGIVTLHDAFATHRQVAVNVRLHVFPCAAEKRTVALFQLSPQQPSHAVWAELDRLAATFRCKR